MKSVKDRIESAYSTLHELAQAWRGDWAQFDGRTLRHEIEDWKKSVLDVALDSLKEDVEIDAANAAFRVTHGLCRNGGGHWYEHCRVDRGCTE